MSLRPTQVIANKAESFGIVQSIQGTIARMRQGPKHGGNSHDRAVGKAKQQKPGLLQPQIAVMVHPQEQQKKEVRPVLESRVLGYLRAVGIVGVLWTVAAMILPYFFRAATALIYIASALGLADLYWEKALPKLAKIIGAGVVVIAAGLFTYSIVLFPAQLKCGSYWVKSDYPEGSDIAGIKWRQGFSELRVSIKNPTDRDYDELNISILSPEAVIEIVQSTAIPCSPISQDVATPHDTLGTVFHPLFDTGPKRFRCAKLPSYSTMEFVLAVANVDDLMKLMTKGAVDLGPKPELFGPKRKPEFVIVQASYLVTFKPVTTKYTITVGNG